MNDKFDELAKGMAQSVTRRGALKKFGVGIASAVIASLDSPTRHRQANASINSASRPAREAVNRIRKLLQIPTSSA